MLDLYEANTEFALLKVTSSDYDTFYSCCPEPYPLIRFDLQFARYPLTYFSGIVLPLVLVTISGTRRLPSTRPGVGDEAQTRSLSLSQASSRSSSTPTRASASRSARPGVLEIDDC